MQIMADLQKLQDELAALQDAMKSTGEADMLAEKELWEAIGEHPDLMALHDKSLKAILAKDTANVAWNNRRKEVSDELAIHFAANPEDRGKIVAFNYDNTKDYNYDSTSAVKALVTNEMLWLLQPKKKEFESFLAANSVQDKATKEWTTPGPIMEWLGFSFVENRIRAKIGNDKLVVPKAE